MLLLPSVEDPALPVGVDVGLELLSLLTALPVLSAPEVCVPVLLAALPVLLASVLFASVLLAAVLPVPDGAGVDDAVAAVLWLLVGLGGSCAPHKLSTRHEVWQFES